MLWNPQSATELAWFYTHSVDYLFANAIHEAPAPTLNFLTPKVHCSGGNGPTVQLWYCILRTKTVYCIISEPVRSGIKNEQEVLLCSFCCCDHQVEANSVVTMHSMFSLGKQTQFLDPTSLACDMSLEVNVLLCSFCCCDHHNYQKSMFCCVLSVLVKITNSKRIVMSGCDRIRSKRSAVFFLFLWRSQIASGLKRPSGTSYQRENVGIPTYNHTVLYYL